MSEVKVNKISPRAACGTVTLGDSGDTFTIPSGATINNQGTALNFGATGSASWVTTVKTSGFTAVAGEGYFVNTTSGPISVNLPAGTAGAVVAFKDYAGTFSASNKVTLVQNGSDKIGGSTVNASLTTEGIAVTLIFIDSTQGWLVTDDGLQSAVPTAQYISATGGTTSTAPCGNYKIHTFTGPGTFCVASLGNPSGGGDTVSYVVVAGGGGGGKDRAGGGGAGGYRESRAANDSYTASPLNATSGPTYNLSVTVQGYPIVVGGGGPGGNTPPGAANGTNGANSQFSTIESAGGGGGHTSNVTPYAGNAGGSGGGGGGSVSGTAGAGNTPPTSPPQGEPGGAGQDGPNSRGAGGGGAGAAAAGAPTSPSSATPGGAGVATSITGASVTRAGGGGSTGTPPVTTAPGGSGGGGDGGNPAGTNGTANTGGGGGGSQGANGATGGPGVVIIRYKIG
jgi:hypothetical protein